MPCTQIGQRQVGPCLAQGVQAPARAVAAQLAKDPLAPVQRDHERAVARQAIGFDDDDLALVELGRHVVAQHTQREGLAIWLALLNSTPGYRLKLDNWKGEWICGQITSDWLRDFFKYYKPGEMGLAVERRCP